MIIDRFGSTYATAYQLSKHNVVDDYIITRASAIERVGGMGGAFDFYGTNNYPVQPLTIRKTFSLTSIETFPGTGLVSNSFGDMHFDGTGTRFLTEAVVGDLIAVGTHSGLVTLVSSDIYLETSTYVSTVSSDPFTITPVVSKAAVERQINRLREMTIAQGESKLWSLGRDGVKRWCYAKCTSLKTPEKSTDVYSVDVTIEFLCREGLWYSENATSTTFNQGSSYPLSVPTVGNYYSPCVFRVTPSGGTITSMTVTNATNGDTFTWAGTVASGKELLVNSGAYTVTNDGAGAYAGLTIGANQVNWLRLNPGANAVTVTLNGGGATGWSGAIIRNDMYL